MSDDMNDLERRLGRLGNAAVPGLDEARVDAIAQRVLAEPHSGRRTSWITAAAAACVIFVVGVALALRDDGENSVQPSTPTETLVETTQPEPESTSTTSSFVPLPTTSVTTTATESTVGSTTPATAATTVPTSTVAPDTIPPASFALTVERVGSELHFSWSQFSGADGRRYVLIRIDADRLASWPVSESRIAVTTSDLSTTNATLTLRAQRHRWVLAVIGENRRLIAVSTVAVSD